MLSQNNEIERRSRLIVLVYEVLLEMETPAEEATNTAVLSALSRAFFDKATVLDQATTHMKSEVAALRERNIGMFARSM